jgi:hypothetical protein
LESGGLAATARPQERIKFSPLDFKADGIESANLASIGGESLSQVVDRQHTL